MSAPVFDQAWSAFPYPLTAATFSLDVTTAGTDRVLLVVIGGDVYGQLCPSVVSVTSAGLTFNKLAGPFTVSDHADEIHASGGNGSIEYWWATASAQLTAHPVTVQLSGNYTSGFALKSGFYGAMVLAYSGCSSPTNPWDATMGLPVIVDGAAPQPDATFNVADRSGIVFQLGDETDYYETWYICGLVGSTATLPISLCAHIVTGPSATNSGVAAGWDLGLRLTNTSENGQFLFIGGFEYSASPPPPTGTTLSLDNVVVTSLTAESPCTARLFDSSFGAVGPSLGLRWSDTRGLTFGNAVPQDFRTDPLWQAQWNRTGMARDRVFELFYSAALRSAINGAFVEVFPLKT